MKGKFTSLLLVLAALSFCSHQTVAQSLPSEMHFTADGRMLMLGDNANTGLYDQSTIRSVYLTFSQPNYWTLLQNNYSSQTDLIATMVVDGVTYDSVGVRFKGQTSYSMSGTSQKKSFNISLDYLKSSQRLMGYRTLNLNNSFQDPSFMREVFYQSQIKKHIPAAKSAYVKLYINGANWGVYPNVQQLNGDFLKEWFFSNNGTNWRADKPPGSPGGPGGGWGDGTAALNYLGADSSLYKPYYTLKSTDKLTPWSDLVNTANVLNTTPLANLPTSLPAVLDIDRTLWFLASENLFSDDDGYIYKGKMDYYAYWEAETGRMTPLEYDGNSVMETNFATWSPFYNETKINYPLMNRLFAVPEYRQRYLAHLRTIMNDYFNATSAGAKLDAYKAQIDTMVQNDPKKATTYSAFVSEVQVLKNFMTTRRNTYNANTEYNQPTPAIAATAFYFGGIAWQQPNPGVPVNVRTTVTSANGISNVYLYYSNALVGNFTRIAMYDDGLHDDGATGDGVYGEAIPAFAAGTYVRFYIEAAGNNTAKTVSYDPPGAEHNVYTYLITPALASVSDVVINELMASNTTAVPDNFGEFDDWIELYNKSGNSVDLTNFHLTDNPLNLTKWKIPAGTVMPPNTYLIVWADEDSSQGPFHANFKLSSLGEQVWLINTAGQIADSISWGQQITDMAFARVPNGTGNFLIQQHTYAANNNLSSIAPSVNKAFALYPNPTNQAFNLNFAVQPIGSIQVYNAQGRLMHMQTAMLNQIISVEGWPAGIYLVRAGEVTRKVVVKE